MRNLNTFPVPGRRKHNTEKFEGFKGVDFTTDSTQVNAYRSPEAPNMVSDSGGFPEKRLGWRTLDKVEAPVNGLFHCEIDGTTKFLVHGGTKIYEFDGKILKVIREGVNNHRSSFFFVTDKAYVLTGKEYLVYDGKEIKPVEGFIPTTTISSKPAGGGVAFDEVNLIQPKRKNGFLADGTSAKYQLDTTDITSVDEITVNGTATTEYTVDLKTGVITFSTPPAAPAVAGQDNVFVTFSKTVEGYADRINGCTISTIYGGTGADRVFVTGNPKFKSTDWVCALNDPTYFPDLSYTNVGVDGTEIVGYCRIGDEQAIFKRDNQQDSTIYLRYVSANPLTGKKAFAIKQGLQGIGALATGSFGYLLDEPLFLSRRGIYALTNNAITYSNSVQNRSYFVDARLTKEPNLQDAVSAVWLGYYILCVNNHCYLLDGNQNRAYKPQSYGDFVYECYYWENIPARVFSTYDNHLFFGTADGRICRFNDDDPTMSRYADDGKPIKAAWATKSTDHGDFMMLKTLVKKGCGILTKPYTHSSATIEIRTNNDFGRVTNTRNLSLFDFNDIDFANFSFVTNDAPQVLTMNSKAKKYSTIQVIVRNEVINEGFGIFGIILRYTVGNYYK